MTAIIKENKRIFHWICGTHLTIFSGGGKQHKNKTHSFKKSLTHELKDLQHAHLFIFSYCISNNKFCEHFFRIHYSEVNRDKYYLPLLKDHIQVTKLSNISTSTPSFLFVTHLFFLHWHQTPLSCITITMNFAIATI